MQANPFKVLRTYYTALRTWHDNNCFRRRLLSEAINVVTSRVVYDWEFAKNDKGETERAIRLRLVQRGYMDAEAFDVETSSETSRRVNRKLLASAAACNRKLVTDSFGIDKAFLEGLTGKELAAAADENERQACFALPPGSAAVLRQLPGSSNYDEAKHCLQCLGPGAGAKGAPRAFALKLNAITRGFVFQGTKCDEEFEVSSNLITAKHVDDVNVAG